MERNYVKRAIESILFASDKPVSVKMLLQVFPDLERDTLHECLSELRGEWDRLGRGFSLEEVAGGYQFRTLPQFGEFVLRFKQSKPFRLSRAALEVLAIIAYKQPVTRLEVEQIRGVDSSGVINLMLEKRLIIICGRKEVIGKPFLYGTTQEFLEIFGLKVLTDLPTLRELEEIEKSIRQTLDSQ